MKRRDLIKYVESHGCVLLREGSRHSIYHNPANNLTAPVPRHAEIADLLARKICRQLDIPSVK
jgi:predicted RNA binding protein YcfA (HicA-like mRNA interferase family)